MSLDSASLKSAIAGKIPESVKATAGGFKAQFLEAKQSTQYLIGGGAAAIVLLLVVIGGGSSESLGSSVTFEARRGDLDITVLEGGALEAMQSQEIRSQIKGREGVKILNIVEEGYRITPEDVATGLVLVQLDTAQLIDQQLNQEIAVETAEATYIERKAQYEIQINQNMTDLNDARQDMRFAHLDFEKFLGANIVNEIVAELEIEERLVAAEAAELVAASQSESTVDLGQVAAASRGPGNQAAAGDFDIDSLPARMQERVRELMEENGGEIPPEMLERMQQFSQGGFSGGHRAGGQPRGQSAAATPAVPVKDGGGTEDTIVLELEPLKPTVLATTANLLMDDSYMLIRDQLDFTQYANMDILEDGEAKQQLRSLQDDLQVSQEELLLAQDRIEGQRRLEARGFINPTELEAEELNLNKADNKTAEKGTALKLYIQYSFPKDAEELLSDYENAIMGFQRQLKENVAELAQEAARFSSAERKFNLEREKLADLNEQIELASIKALQPGLVVYGGSNQNSMRFRGNSSQEAIQEGSTVRERQPILTIPDMREMAIKVNIHESVVQRVAAGQYVKVSIDAFPDVELSGEVIKVAVVADSANAFMNPDLKVYPTTIRIDGEHDWLRPGMSAEVKILVDSLEDVVYVPLQAITYYDDQRVVYVKRGTRAERRDVEVGTFSEQFIEITSGLQQGEDVLLLPPQQSLADVSRG